MPATDETDRNETAQPGSATSATIAVSVDEAAAHFGISPQAVRKRIAAGHLEAQRVGRSWRVYIPTKPSETETSERFRETSKPADTKPVALSQRDQFALMVDPVVAPWVAKVEELSREAERNRLRAEVAEERLAAAEQERDELRRQLAEAESQRSEPASPQTRQDGSGRMEAASLTDESNTGPSKASRSVFGDFVAWVRRR